MRSTRKGSSHPAAPYFAKFSEFSLVERMLLALMLLCGLYGFGMAIYAVLISQYCLALTMTAFGFICWFGTLLHRVRDTPHEAGKRVTREPRRGKGL